MMISTIQRFRLALASGLLVSMAGVDGISCAGEEPSRERIDFFEGKIRPLLVERCYECHSADAKKIKGHLRLDSREELLKGGDTGPAEKRTLLRRATFDLIGLPPTPEEIGAFVADKSRGAFEKVIDRLLASPHYGERWGRHWLDLARYADTSGCNSDFPVPTAYKYRDYVIKAFNQDKPYDQFLKEQLAGDLLPESAKPEEKWDGIIATGYLAEARRFGSRN